jgi:hypothetical protein
MDAATALLPAKLQGPEDEVQGSQILENDGRSEPVT